MPPIRLPPQPNEQISRVVEDLAIVGIDEKAAQENKDYVSDKKRKRREQNIVHWAFVVFVWTGVLAFIFVLAAKVSHLVLPPKFDWLADVHLKKLDDFLTSGIIGGTVTAIFKSKIQGKHSD